MLLLNMIVGYTTLKKILRACITNSEASHKHFFFLRLIITANSRTNQCLTRATTFPEEGDIPMTSQ